MSVSIISVEDKIHGTTTAKRMESRTDERWFVTVTRDRNNPNGNHLIWAVTNKMPFFGEWFDSDGIRHG